MAREVLLLDLLPAPNGQKAAAGPSAAPPTTTTDDEDDFVMYASIDSSPLEVTGKDKAPITDPADQLRAVEQGRNPLLQLRVPLQHRACLVSQPLTTTRTLLPRLPRLPAISRTSS